MTFWGGSRLATHGRAQRIVQPFEDDRIDCSAYELTLGAEAYVTPRHGDDPRQNLKLKLNPAEVEQIGAAVQVKGGGTVVIPPGQFALLLTEEIISLPASVMGFISLKLKPKFKGLINVSGFSVDPGFEGRLIFSVYNAGPSVIRFARGDRLFQLWIADLSEGTPEADDGLENRKRRKPGYADIPSEVVADVAQERHSLQALADRVDELSNQVKLFSALAAGMAVAAGLFFAAIKLLPDCTGTTSELCASNHQDQMPDQAIRSTSGPNPLELPNPSNSIGSSTSVGAGDGRPQQSQGN